MYDDARAERDFRMNPPSSAPGQGSDDDWDSLSTGSSSVENFNFGGSGDGGFGSSGGSSFGSGGFGTGGFGSGGFGSGGFGSSGFGGSFGNGFGQQNQPQNQNSSVEDKIFDGALVAGKGVVSYFKALVKSLQNNTEADWHRLGERITIISGGVCVVAIMLMLLGLVVPQIQQPSDLLIGGIFSCMVGVALLMFNNLNKENSSQDATVQNDIPSIDIGMDTEFNFDEPVDDVSSLGQDDDEFDIDLDDILDDEMLSGISFEDDEEEVKSNPETFDLDSAMSSIKEIPEGTWTRQYLFETFSSVLPNINPNFNVMEEITDVSDEFMMLEDYLRSAAFQVGTKEENVPELLEVKKNSFIIQLKATRPSGLKEQEIADELANRYSRDDDGNIIHDGVYATVDSMVGALFINIFLCNNVMVSLADMYGVIKDDILNTKNRFPFVWGITERGKVLNCDLYDCESIMVSGEARGGKSWKGQSIVAQLAMYSSPKEVNFYIFDHKNQASDYLLPSRVLPHIRYFCGDVNRIVPDLKRVIDSVSKRTGKLLADSGCLNIKDYNRLNPLDKLPFVYIVIDELMSLMNSLTKEDAEEFRSLTDIIVSKLPYLGIRLIMFPHRIVNSVISKNSYSLVSTRAVVFAANQDPIKEALGTTPKTFPYKLNNMGDMGIVSKQIERGKPTYCHAEVLTSSNETNMDVFRFIGSVWQKLMPECTCIEVHNGVGGSISGSFSQEIFEGSSKSARDNTIETIVEEEEFSLTDDVEDDVNEDFWKDFENSLN